jgi:hypothetical protein
VVNGEMILNAYGIIAFNEWLKTPELRPNVELGEFIIMPNHMHGIIRLSGRGELHSPNNCRGELHSPDNNELHVPDQGGVCKTPPTVTIANGWGHCSWLQIIGYQAIGFNGF